jgi:tetratricopeptide (TPR) repeat protein
MPDTDSLPIIQRHFERSSALHAEKRFNEAIAELQKVFKLSPDLPEAHFNMGNILRDSGNVDLSVEAYIAAVKAAENKGRRYPEALINLGDVFMKQKRLDYALIAFREATEAAPRMAEAWMGLGVARYESHDLSGALAAYTTALTFAPNHVGLVNNLALTSFRLGNLYASLAFYDRLIAIAPEMPEARTDRALILLHFGRFEEGLRDYEYRWGMDRLRHTRHRTGAPDWRNEPLKGKTIVAYGEQGYGDAFQFCRYLSRLTAMGAYVIALVERPIVKVIESVPGVALTLPSGAVEALPPHEYSVAMMSLPYHFGTTPDTIPAKVPYIFADEDLTAKWRKTLSPLGGLKVGLVWAGRPEHPFDHERSMTLAILAPLAQVADISFVSLQQGPRADEEGLEVFRPGPLADFAETAAIVENLDLVIGVDTSVTHLVGAMGKPIWLLLPLVAEWRWALQPETSPWYPTMRLFRQTVRDDWTGPVNLVVEALRKQMGSDGIIARLND